MDYSKKKYLKYKKKYLELKKQIGGTPISDEEIYQFIQDIINDNIEIIQREENINCIYSFKVGDIYYILIGEIHKKSDTNILMNIIQQIEKKDDYENKIDIFIEDFLQKLDKIYTQNIINILEDNSKESEITYQEEDEKTNIEEDEKTYSYIEDEDLEDLDDGKDANILDLRRYISINKSNKINYHFTDIRSLNPNTSRLLMKLYEELFLNSDAKFYNPGIRLYIYITAKLHIKNLYTQFVNTLPLLKKQIIKISDDKLKRSYLDIFRFYKNILLNKQNIYSYIKNLEETKEIDIFYNEQIPNYKITDENLSTIIAEEKKIKECLEIYESFTMDLYAIARMIKSSNSKIRIGYFGAKHTLRYYYHFFSKLEDFELIYYYENFNILHGTVVDNVWKSFNQLYEENPDNVNIFEL